MSVSKKNIRTAVFVDVDSSDPDQPYDRWAFFKEDGSPFDPAELLVKSGGTMTGLLTLAGDPTLPMQAATKQYVLAVRDSIVSGAPGLLDTLEEISSQLLDDESATASLLSVVNSKQDTSEKGHANGYAGLDSGGKVPSAQLPDKGIDVAGATNKQVFAFNTATAHAEARDATEIDARAMFGFGRQTSESDEPAAFQAAVAFAAGRPVRLVKGEYPAVAQLNSVLTDPLRIIGDGADATRIISRGQPLTSFTASAATDVCTTIGAHGYVDTDAVYVVGSSLPGGLIQGVRYYVRDSTSTTFKLAKTSGGVAINLTTDGSGVMERDIGFRIFRNVGSFDYLGYTSPTNEWDKGLLLTAQTLRGTTTYTVPTTVGLAAGDYVKVRDPSQPFISLWDSTQLGVAGQILEVMDVISGTQFRTRGGALHTYAVGSTVIRYNSIKNPILRDFSIRPDNALAAISAANIAIELQHCVDAELDGLYFENMPGTMINLLHCYGFVVKNCKSRNGRNDLGTGPYFVKPAVGCQAGLIRNCESWYGRHLTTTTGLAHDIASQIIDVVACRGYEHGGTVFDEHPAGRWWRYVNCLAAINSRNDTAATSANPAFAARGVDTQIINPWVLGCDVGIAATAGTQRLRVEGGLIERCRVGLLTYTFDGIQLVGTKFKDSYEHHMLVTSTAKTTGVAQGLNFDVDSTVHLEGDPSVAPVEFRVWDDGYRFVPRITGNSKPTVGIKTRKLATAATLTIPNNADYWEMTGSTPITRIAAGISQQGRIVALFFPNGGTINAVNAVVTATAVANRTQVMLHNDGSVWSEISPRVVKPVIPVLDAIANASTWRAYGLRKLRTAYAGACIRVRRSNDNVEADIGFTSLGNLDQTALLAHTGANSGYVVTMYDQGAGGLNMTQSTTTRQPRIVNAGVVDTISSGTTPKPVMVFDGVDDGFTSSTPGLMAAGELSIFAVMAATVNAIKALVSEAGGPSSSPSFYLGSTNSGGSKVSYTLTANDGTSVLDAGGQSASAYDGVLRSVSVVDTAAYTDSDDPENTELVYLNNTAKIRTDGSTESTRTYVRSLPVTMTAVGVACRPTSTLSIPMAVKLNEVLMFTRAVDATDRGALETAHAALISS